jgi:hypothetical protein
MKDLTLEELKDSTLYASYEVSVCHDLFFNYWSRLSRIDAKSAEDLRQRELEALRKQICRLDSKNG